MGKKKIRATVVSKGERPSVARSTTNTVRRELSEIDRAIRKIDAWKAGKNPWISIQVAEKGTNQPYKRVRANDLYGDPRRTANIFRAGGDSE